MLLLDTSGKRIRVGVNLGVLFIGGCPGLPKDVFSIAGVLKLTFRCEPVPFARKGRNQF